MPRRCQEDALNPAPLAGFRENPGFSMWLALLEIRENSENPILFKPELSSNLDSPYWFFFLNLPVIHSPTLTPTIATQTSTFVIWSFEMQPKSDFVVFGTSAIVMMRKRRQD